MLIIKIPVRAACCSQKKEPFVPNSEMISYIKFHDEEAVREDYCMECWNQVEEEKKRAGGSFWRVKISPKKKERIFHDQESLALFRKLQGASSSEEQKLLYLLALYLERRKQLVRRPLQGTSKAVRYYEIVETGELFAVTACTLSPKENALLMAEIQTKLASDDV